MREGPGFGADDRQRLLPVVHDHVDPVADPEPGPVDVVVCAATGLAMAAALIAGMSIGALNGIFVGRLGLSAFMVTLATFALARGLALVLLDATSIGTDDEVYLWLGKTTIGEDFPVSIVFVALVILGAGLSGMTAAYTLQLGGEDHWQVYERESNVGGLARTMEVDGYRFDYGPHILFTIDKEIIYPLLIRFSIFYRCQSHMTVQSI